MKLLIVEANPLMRRLIRNLVQEMADELCECADGSQALAAYEQQHPDWVLMDLQLGDTDGLTAARQIKASHPEACIVMLADFDDDALRAEAEQAGMHSYVLKENLFAIRALLKLAARKERGSAS